MRSDWKTYKLSEIGKIIGGGTPSTKSSSYWGKGHPWITPKDLSNYNNRYISCGARSITANGLSNSSARLLPPKTVLITSRAPIGYLAIAETEVTTNQGFKSIVPNEKLCTSEFVYYLLKSNVDKLVQYSSGSTFQEISGKVLGSLEFSFPSLPEQRRIAALLGALDDKIELNRKMNQTLEEMAQAIFKSWFIDFDGVPEEDLVESELGLIPRGWEVCTLEEISESIVDCLHSKKPDHIDNMNRMVQVYNIGKTGRLAWDKVYQVSDEDHQKWTKRLKPQKGDVFISKTGRVGAIAQVLDELDISFGRNIVAIRPDESRYPKYVFGVMLLSDTAKREIERLSSDGTILRSIHVKHVRKIRCIVPPITLLSKIDDTLKPLIETLNHNDNYCQTLAELRDTLLPKLISGELRIPEAEEQVTDALS